MSRKIIELSRNSTGGIDLITERDAGNPIRILTGKRERSIDFWKRLKEFSEEALDEMDGAE